MSKNSNVFQLNPTKLDISRSRIPLNHTWTGSFKAGLLIPIFSYGDVLPGDTFKVSMSCVVRSTTPVAPVMDDAYLDVFAFFVPHELVLSRQSMSPSVNDSNHSFKAIMGAQDSLLNMPLPDNDAKIPVVNFGAGDISSGDDSPFAIGSLSDYLCMPDGGVSVKGHWVRKISCLEPLAYYSIWNDFFRDPNTMNPVTYSIIPGSTTTEGEDYVSFSGGPNGHVFGGGLHQARIGNLGTVMPTCRFHGYFGSALPWPQRNSESVLLPLGDDAPVVSPNSSQPSYWVKDGDDLPLSVTSTLVSGGQGSASGPLSAGAQGATAQATLIYPNLVADLSKATAASVNQFRQAVQLQRWYEALARGGNRMSELKQSMFGVTPHNLGDDRAEYLGGKRIRLNVTQVANTAGTNVSTATQQSIGSTGAYSLTSDSDFYFTKSFDSWGTIMFVATVRTHDSFHQGLKRRYTRRSKFDFYWPQFANLGEQEINDNEIYWSDQNDSQSVFGYQEAWAEYRYEPDAVCGLMRPGQSVSYWGYCNHFSQVPTLPGYLSAESEQENIDRTLQVSGETAGFQYIGQFGFDITAVRPMPLYSIPGLVDHH